MVNRNILQFLFLQLMNIVMSSANREHCIGGLTIVGRSLMVMLNRVGLRTDP